jgi:hypothetical protein
VKSFQGRTEFTPRAYPSLTNIRNLMPPELAANIGDAWPPAYDPPDVFNPYLNPPPDAVDVLSIIEAGVEFRSNLNPSYAEKFYKKPTFAEPPKVERGKGISKDVKSGDYYCDGSLDSFCGRSRGSGCLLNGHNDGRTGLLFDGYSGWVVMNIPDLKNGYVVVKLETWHKENAVGKTADWTSINNDNALEAGESPSTPEEPESGENRRDLKKKNKKKPLCGSFKFEYAVDGVVTSLNATEFTERQEPGHIQRVVETFVLLKDPDYTGGEEKEIEVAIRIRGCRQRTSFKLTHIYWS